MLKYLLYLNLLLYATYIDAKVFKKGPLLDNSLDDNGKESEKPWHGLWFPLPPDYHASEVKNSAKNVNVAKTISPPDNNINENNQESQKQWHGLWFPHPANYHANELKTDNVANVVKKNGNDSNASASSWPGLWFPNAPNEGDLKASTKTLSRGHHLDDFLDPHECDNGQTNIAIDFDPEDKRHSYQYLCLANHTEYLPNLNTNALLMEHLVPPAYQPPVRCLSDKITYEESLPTFGAYRPLAPKFGTYKYLPPQRWLHSLAEGAIVFLYHPCAFPDQIKQLQNTLQGCLYRHIVTPSQLLTPERPLALLAWGKCLQMSVVDDKLSVQFIKENAKLGFQRKQQKLQMSLTHFYDAGLLNEAHLVTDEQDLEICGYKEM